jgi:hypothetical protein
VFRQIHDADTIAFGKLNPISDTDLIVYGLIIYGTATSFLGTIP